MTLDVSAEPVRRLRCALFVDFDNVYIGLQRLDPAAAESFAGSPGHWLEALTAGSDADGDFERRFLVRSCYLNPSAFSQFRPNFTRAGFSVVDCPSLTQQGKSSADINLVLDAVDALAAGTRYDEFVILSSDADFTPLALRCRASDRRVTIVTAGPAASAYRAVADTVITADELLGLLLRTDDDLLAAAPPLVPAVPVTGSAGRGQRGSGRGGSGRSAAAGAPTGGPSSPAAGAPAGAVGPAERRGDEPGPEDPTTAAGAGTAGRGGRASDERTPEARGSDERTPDERTSDERASDVRGSDARTSGGVPAAEPAPDGAAYRSGRLERPTGGARSAGARAVARAVRAADRPLNGGPLAQRAQAAEPTLVPGWAGAGGFFPWLARELPQLSGAQGFVWDPERFSEADLPGAAPVDLPPLQRQVVEVTDIPNLPTERYRVLLTALADDVAAHRFERTETARRVRDACQAAGEAIGRGSVNTVIAGVLYSGLDLAARPSAADVADTWADNVVGLCRGARMDLSPQDVAAIRGWVGGGLARR
ncbi:NYN domain-containing protein [Cellulomonas marina]|uniref:Uncharacterized conserved protein, LabA/DUF88 family n=1 Tax=Cellulomonas marina TaxID=988821 RepID=A0A1I0ZC26_9CELL|nr:NYN domain-containing protein [Cellulomonas marina]GIG30624.1 hypothetical protein Cma02nite_32240 [Cellulomonas marina]SFB22927.1 Uncharacterized conserved protein, LabA/DUF88 family [Cellulomonas marina]